MSRAKPGGAWRTHDNDVSYCAPAQCVPDLLDVSQGGHHHTIDDGRTYKAKPDRSWRENGHVTSLEEKLLASRKRPDVG